MVEAESEEQMKAVAERISAAIRNSLGIPVEV
jgi:hypothetical protein